ncbi:MAG: DUF4397 domain-containing protein [Chitinophagaceae bacterium]
MKFTNFSKRTGAIALFSSALMLTMSACNKDHNNSDNEDIPVAGLMAFNLAPDISSAGVAVGGNNTANNLTYGSFTGGYLGVYPGEHTLESYNAASGARLASGRFNFNDSAYYSVFIVGTNNNYSNLIVKDDTAGLTANGTAYIRYVNAIPDSSKPTVTVGNVVNEPAAFKNISGFKSVPAGSVALSVSNGGSISATRSITVEANKLYTVLLSGQPASGTVTGNVAIKFITNGTLDTKAAKSASASARAVN